MTIKKIQSLEADAMKRVAAYCRVSTQRDEQEESRAEYDQPVMQGVMYNFVKHDNSSIE